MERDVSQRPDSYPRPTMWAYRTSQAFGRYVLFPLLFEIHLRGLEHVPPDGALIMAANHMSNFDPLILGTYIPRVTTFVAKRELYRAAPLRVWWHLLGAVAVRRDGLDMRPLRQLLRLLAGGGTVGMFPEGTRSRGRGLQRPVAGVAYLAAKSGAQILPVGIWGAQTLMLEDRVRNGRPRVEIQVGWPFEFETRTDRLTSEALDQMGDSLMRRIALLLPERLRGVYATPKAEAASG